MTIELTKDNFKSEIEKSDVPVLVDFWAPWCGPCRMLSPLLDRIEKKQAGKAKVFKVNVDEQPELASQFGIRGIPTVIAFDNGIVKTQLVGVRSEAEYEAAIS